MTRISKVPMGRILRAKASVFAGAGQVHNHFTHWPKRLRQAKKRLVWLIVIPASLGACGVVDQIGDLGNRVRDAFSF